MEANQEFEIQSVSPFQGHGDTSWYHFVCKQESVPASKGERVHDSITPKNSSVMTASAWKEEQARPLGPHRGD